jgi:hypothetical protein
MFLKEKRTGRVKGRGCADGQKQPLYTAKEDTSSQTVSIESIMLTSVINALEGRHVATADIPGAFMQAVMDKVVHMRLVGTMVNLLLQITPEYERYVVIKGGQRVLYVLLLKALYGTIRAALFVLAQAHVQTTGVGIRDEPVRPVRREQDDERHAVQRAPYGGTSTTSRSCTSTQRQSRRCSGC